MNKKLLKYVISTILLLFSIAMLSAYAYYKQYQDPVVLSINLCEDISIFKTNQQQNQYNPLVEFYTERIMMTNHRIPKSIAIQIAQGIIKTKDPDLIYSVLKVESTFNPFVVSKAKAVGLAQIKPKFWFDKLKSAGIVNEYRDLFDPEKGPILAQFVLDECLSLANGNIEKALQIYYCGRNNRSCYAGRRHAEKILVEYAKIKFSKKSVVNSNLRG